MTPQLIERMTCELCAARTAEVVLSHLNLIFKLINLSFFPFVSTTGWVAGKH